MVVAYFKPLSKHSEDIELNHYILQRFLIIANYSYIAFKLHAITNLAASICKGCYINDKIFSISFDIYISDKCLITLRFLEVKSMKIS